MGQIYVFRGGRCVPIEEAEPLYPSWEPNRGVITDAIDPTMNHATGQMTDSKSVLRRSYKSLGLTEVGNERPKIAKPDFSDKYKRERKDQIANIVTKHGF